MAYDALTTRATTETDSSWRSRPKEGRAHDNDYGLVPLEV